MKQSDTTKIRSARRWPLRHFCGVAARVIEHLLWKLDEDIRTCRKVYLMHQRAWIKPGSLHVASFLVTGTCWRTRSLLRTRSAQLGTRSRTMFTRRGTHRGRLHGPRQQLRSAAEAFWW